MLQVKAKHGYGRYGLLLGVIVITVGGQTSLALTASARTFNKETSHAKVNLSVQFEGSASDIPACCTINTLEWEWDFGDDSTSTSRNPPHSYSSGGAKNVTLTVSCPHGCGEDDDTCTVHVISNIIIDEITSGPYVRPSDKMSFNNKNAVKGHAYPNSLPSCCDDKIDWEMDDVPRADCNLRDNSGGTDGASLNWTQNWPTSNGDWGSGDALVSAIDKWTGTYDETDDLDTSGGYLQASISIAKYYNATGTENPTRTHLKNASEG